jgi:cytochrome c556
MKRIFVLSVISIAATTAFSFSSPAKEGAQHAAEHSHGPAARHEPAGDPLIEEMVALDGVFRDVVSAVALSDGHRVHEALEKMHGTMEKTHEGVKHGTVTLKKNANRMSEFVAQDKQFHGKLEDLAKAAHRNDSGAMVSLTNELLDRCVKCHRDFRMP